MVTKIKFSDFRSIIKCPCAPPFCGYCEPLSSSFQPHRFPLKSPTGRGFSPFPFLPSDGRRVTAIQFYFVVLIDIFYYGRGLGARVDGTSSRRFLRFLRFLSLTAFQAEGCGGGFAADYKKGARLRRGLCRRGVKGKVLRMDRPRGRRVLKFDGAFGPEGGGIALRCTANTFCTMRTGFVRKRQRPENPVSQ